jgi:hypothetical protein
VELAATETSRVFLLHTDCAVIATPWLTRRGPTPHARTPYRCNAKSRTRMSLPSLEPAAHVWPVAVSECDVCSVARDVNTVVMHFGKQGASALDPDTLAVELRHRVTLGEETASRLQELMAALLNEAPAPRDGAS